MCPRGRRILVPTRVSHGASAPATSDSRRRLLSEGEIPSRRRAKILRTSGLGHLVNPRKKDRLKTLSAAVAAFEEALAMVREQRISSTWSLVVQGQAETAGCSACHGGDARAAMTANLFPSVSSGGSPCPVAPGLTCRRPVVRVHMPLSASAPKSLSAVSSRALSRFACSSTTSSDTPGADSVTYPTSWPAVRRRSTICRSTLSSARNFSESPR